jgi:hypothetical protein
MNKWLITAALFAMLPSVHGLQVGTPQPESTRKQQEKQRVHKKQAQPENAPAATATPSPASHEISQPKIEATERQYDPRSDRLYRLYLLGTVVGVAGGLIGLFFLVVQVVASKQAAKAALKNATALINAERAWVFVDRGETGADKIQDPYLLPVGHPDIRPNQERIAHCVFFIRNFGKTPAKVTGWRTELLIGDSANEPPNLKFYDIPNDPFGVYFIPPNNAVAQEARLPSGFAEWKEFQDVEDGRRYAWLVGVIRYLDVISDIEKEHETRFCYLWETRLNSPKPFWRQAGRPEYNRAT